MSLQKLCLATIGKSIDRFCRAYCTTDNNDLQQRFDFLQKIYAFQLISCLNKWNMLEDDYIPLLFSSYLVSVKTKWFRKLSKARIHDIFGKIGPNLLNVVFDKDYEGIQWENVICYLSNVRHISYQFSCNNTVLAHIGKYCPRLETLDIKCSGLVNDYGLKYLYEKVERILPCPLLRKLNVQSTSISNEGIKQLLKALPQLRRIDYSQLPKVLYDIYNNNILGKVERYKLMHLNLLNYYRIADTSYYEELLNNCVELCPKLRCFHYPLFKLEHLSFCSVLPYVKDLNLYFVNDLGIEVNDIVKEKSRKLTSLTLHNCSVSLSVLEQCVHLNYLNMKRVHIQYDDNDSLPMFPKLKTFILKKMNISMPVYSKVLSRVLASTPNLRYLYLKCFRYFTSEVKIQILNACERYALKVIDICGGTVNIEFLKAIILTCSTLKTLKFSESNYDDEFRHNLDTVINNAPNKPQLLVIFDFEENASFTDGFSEDSEASLDDNWDNEDQ